MAYGNKYRLAYTNKQNELHEVFFAYEGYVGPVADIIGSDDALHINSTGSDDDKFVYILGKEATIQIWIQDTDPMTIEDFIAENDTDIKVTVYAHEQYNDPVFEGFIMVQDNNEPFLDKPWPLTIKATDTFGLLKNLDFVDLDGDKYVGFFSIVDILSQIFYRLNPEQNFRTYFDFAEITMQRKHTTPTADAFKEMILNVNMFDGMKCYDVLQKLCDDFECRVFQQQGLVHFMNILAFNTGVANYVEYSFSTPSNGVVLWNQVGQALGEDYSQPVGKSEIITPVNEDQVRYIKLKNHSIKKTFNYDQSANKLCGQDFPLDARLPQYDQEVGGEDTLAYSSNCWVYLRTFPALPPSQAVYIRSVIDDLGFKKDRYAVIDRMHWTSASYLNTSSFYIDQGDKLNFSFSFRVRNGTSGGSGNLPVMGLFLEGDNGVKYTLQKTMNNVTSPSLNEWQALPSVNDWTPQVFISLSSSDTLAEFGSYSADENIKDNPLPQVPVSGKIRVLFFCDTTASRQEYNYKDLTFTIIPNINGGFSDSLKGDYNKITSSQQSKQNVDETIDISDSPKRWLKGALLKRVPAPSNYAICQPDWDRSDTPTVTQHFRFTQAMELVKYFHTSLPTNKIEGTFRGYLTRDFVITGYKNFYKFVDKWPSKIFMLTSFDMDMAEGTWRGVFVECPVLGQIAPIDSYIFDLIFDNG